MYEQIQPPVITGSHVITACWHWKRAFIRTVYNTSRYNKCPLACWQLITAMNSLTGINTSFKLPRYLCQKVTTNIWKHNDGITQHYFCTYKNAVLKVQWLDVIIITCEWLWLQRLKYSVTWPVRWGQFWYLPFQHAPFLTMISQVYWWGEHFLHSASCVQTLDNKSMRLWNAVRLGPATLFGLFSLFAM